MSNKLDELKNAHQSVCELLDSRFVGLDLLAHLQELKLSLELQISELHLAELQESARAKSAAQ